MSTAAIRLNVADARKRLGQVFTPRPVADWMADWACARRPRRILEPAVGEGVFVDAIESIWRRKKWVLSSIDAVEVDAALARSFERNSRSVRVRCRVGDFLRVDGQTRYDAIVSNPPYVRHHDFECDDTIRREFDILCGERISRNVNLYGLFLLRIWTLLGRGGRAAVITPAEWLNADFGAAIKRFLLSQNAIDVIVQFDPAANIFPGILTTAAITLLRRDRKSDEPVRFCRAGSVANLAELRVKDGRAIRPGELDANAKWSALFAEPRIKLRTEATLGEIARCTRGIATGANNYFTLRPSELRRWGLSMRDVKPCITRARQIAPLIFTRQALQKLVAADERIYLLSPRMPLSRAVREYLAEGRRRGIDRRYLPAHRPVWYMPEERPAAPILVSVFARERFRFAWNRAGVVSLTAYHGVYPVDSTPSHVRALHEYVTSDAGQAAIRRHCRIYGDGLLKVEPRDVEAMEIPPELRRT